MADLNNPLVVTNIITSLSSLLQRVAGSNDALLYLQPQKLSIFHGPIPCTIPIRSYLERLFKYANCSPSCLVVTYAYLDRFAALKSPLIINSHTVHRLLLTSFMLAVKFLDDIHYSNAYFAKVGGLDTKQMNLLEVEFLFGSLFRMNVNLTGFHKYCSSLQRELVLTSPLRVVQSPQNLARGLQLHCCINEDESTHRRKHRYPKASHVFFGFQGW